MKRYKQLKDLPWSKKGAVWTQEGMDYFRTDQTSNFTMPYWQIALNGSDWFEPIDECECDQVFKNEHGCTACKRKLTDSDKEALLPILKKEKPKKIEELPVVVSCKFDYTNLVTTQQKINQIIDSHEDLRERLERAERYIADQILLKD